MAPLPYSPGDITRSHAWLHHNGGLTEATILHPDYHADDKEWNREHGAWPITRYLDNTADLLRIVRTYAGERMICYGLNPRPSALTNPDGRKRSAKESDIALSQTLLLDIDLDGTITTERAIAFAHFLGNAFEYFTSKGLQRPVNASTGRGVHLLLAYDPITVDDCPDIAARLRTFKRDFATAYRHDLQRLEARVDSTQDLRRMVRVYGTSKPHLGRISVFHGNERKPDPVLREYLLNLTPTPTRMPTPASRSLVITDLLPDWFTTLLANDRVLNALWHNNGKPRTSDQSNSGYDYTIACYLAARGNTHDEIATIIALRPTGAAERARKGVDYLLRTVTAATSRHHGR
jgi:hypothetical protein